MSKTRVAILASLSLGLSACDASRYVCDGVNLETEAASNACAANANDAGAKAMNYQIIPTDRYSKKQREALNLEYCENLLHDSRAGAIASTILYVPEAPMEDVVVEAGKAQCVWVEQVDTGVDAVEAISISFSVRCPIDLNGAMDHAKLKRIQLGNNDDQLDDFTPEDHAYRFRRGTRAFTYQAFAPPCMIEGLDVLGLDHARADELAASLIHEVSLYWPEF